MNTLHMTLKKKWFDMIAAGKKKEEYREIKPYWIKRLMFISEGLLHSFVTKDLEHNGRHYIFNTTIGTITFRNGYTANAPTMVVELLGIEIGKAKPEWSDNWQGEVFIIKLGKVLSITNH